jgi:hypothetical protein
VRFLDVYRLGVLGNVVPGRIFGHKGKEEIRGQRYLYNEELRNLYSSLDIIRAMDVRRMG